MTNVHALTSLAGREGNSLISIKGFRKIAKINSVKTVWKSYWLFKKKLP